MDTLPWGDLSKAKVLVIGHDPNLQESPTQAQHCFFADYYFKPIPSKGNEKAKYNLAKAVFEYTHYLTSNRFTDLEIYITNLCNCKLPKQPPKKTIYIPESKAVEGLQNIRNILKSSKISLIIATSQQVNYWLQKLGFYSSTNKYVDDSEPKPAGVLNNYYEPKGKSPFLQVCGRKYIADGVPLFPVLHIKQYPLRNNIKKNYEILLENCIIDIKSSYRL
jgi:hypothetical protein